MPATTPASHRWPHVFPRPALLLFSVLVAMACGTAEPGKPAASEPRPAADISPSPNSAAQSKAAAAAPARMNVGSPFSTPFSDTSEGQPRVITWGVGPDVFGDTPDKDGYYSSRLHFEHGANDRLRRSLVRLERDPQGQWNLRLSALDIEEMPTVDQILLPLSTTLESASQPSLNDKFRPRFKVAQSSDRVGSNGPELWELKPPEGGFEVLIGGGDFERPYLLRAREVGSVKDLWQVHIPWEPSAYLEFSTERPQRFLLFDDYAGGAIYDLATGLVCKIQGPPGGGLGDFGTWPGFIDFGNALILSQGDVLWRVLLDSCTWERVGSLALPPKQSLIDSFLVSEVVSPDGSSVLATIGETGRQQRSPFGIAPARAQFLILERSGNLYTEKRRVVARLYNAMNGIEGASSDTSRKPFLRITQFRSLTAIPGSTSLRRNPQSAEICFLIVQNAAGNFFALKTPSQTGAGVTIDRNQGLLWYGERWWDLSPFATPITDDQLETSDAR